MNEHWKHLLGLCGEAHFNIAHLLYLIFIVTCVTYAFKKAKNDH